MLAAWITLIVTFVIVPIIFGYAIYKFVVKLREHKLELENKKAQQQAEVKATEKATIVAEKAYAEQLAKNTIESATRIEKFCPNCGGPVTTQSSSCMHCGSLLPGVAAYRQSVKAQDQYLEVKKNESEAPLKLEKMRIDKEEKDRKEQNKEAFKGVMYFLLFMLIVIIFLKITMK